MTVKIHYEEVIDTTAEDTGSLKPIQTSYKISDRPVVSKLPHPKGAELYGATPSARHWH